MVKRRAANIDRVKIRAQFKKYRAELRRERAQASGIIALRSILGAVFSHCDDCGRPLVVIDWNAMVYIITCDLGRCHKFRQPVGTVRKDLLEGLGIKPK